MNEEDNRCHTCDGAGEYQEDCTDPDCGCMGYHIVPCFACKGTGRHEKVRP